MKNTAFTLLELLGVIILLAILGAIVTVSVGKIISNSKNSLLQTQKKNIENAAKVYYIKENIALDNTCISTQELINKGYIEGSEIINTKEVMTGYVRVTYASNQYTYTYQEESCE